MNYKMLALATASALAIMPVSSANAAKPVYGAWGYEPSAMDSSVKPGDDFWAYVSGSWDKRTQIAADRSRAGPFVTLADKSEQDVRTIVEPLASEANRSLTQQQIGDYYGTYMDEATIDRLGAAPLKPYLAQISKAQSKTQL